MTHKVYITGYAAVFPSDIATGKISPNLGQTDLNKIPKKLGRYSSASIPAALTVIEKAAVMAGIDLSQLNNESLGLYTSQSGYQHSDIYDYADALNEWQSHIEPTSVLDSFWNSRQINPFLTVKGLSNNLLGILSLAYNLQGDCGAFTRDEAGAAAALDEARFNVANGFCDTCIVVIAGSNTDSFTQAFNGEETNKAPDNGAVALILQSQASRDDSRLSAPELKALEINYATEQVQLTPSKNVSEVLESQVYNSEENQQWGGLVLSIAQTLSITGKNQGVFTINNQDKQGLHCQALLAL